MRSQYLVMLALSLGTFAACTPDIASGAYLCGPNSSCPDGKACNGPDNVCVLPAQVQPFACEDSTPTQVDLDNVDCVSPPVQLSGCMVATDNAWVTFVPPSVCTAVEVQARLSFPVAFAELGLQLRDYESGMLLATDSECTTGADTGEVRRCLDYQLVPGTKYIITVDLTGEGTCDGACAHNRYSLRVQLATPG